MHAAFLSVASPAVPVRYLVASIAAHGLIAAAPMSAPGPTVDGTPQRLVVNLRQLPPVAAQPVAELNRPRTAPPRTVRARTIPAESPRISVLPAPTLPSVPLTQALSPPPEISAGVKTVDPPESPAPLQLARAAPAAIDLPPLRSGPSDFHLLALYTQQLGSAVNAHRRYPPLARVRGWQGTAILDLGVGPSGEVVSLSVASSSGFDVLDEQAMAMVRAAAPLPSPALGSDSSSLLVQLPVTFSLR